jgi:HAD superfamily hydrolase (TIGR01509 family)
MARAVIFDVDGTLLDSVDLHARAWRDAFRDFGHSFELEAVRRQIGKGGDQLLPMFLSRDEIEASGEKLEHHRAELFKSRYLSRVRAFPGVRDLFIRIIRDGKRIALASSAKCDELEIYEKIADVADLLDAETSSNDARKSKPHPDIFEAALERLGDPPAADAIVVGDTPYDAEAARRIGVRTVGLTCGGWPAAELRQAGCIAVYRDAEDLLAHYDSSALAR